MVMMRSTTAEQKAHICTRPEEGQSSWRSRKGIRRTHANGEVEAQRSWYLVKVIGAQEERQSDVEHRSKEAGKNDEGCEREEDVAKPSPFEELRLNGQRKSSGGCNCQKLTADARTTR